MSDLGRSQSSYLDGYRSTHLGDTKHLEGHLAPVQSTLFGLDLLKSQGISVLVEVAQARSVPLLVFLGIILLQASYVLGHLLKYFRLELTLGLRRAHLGLEAIGAGLGRMKRDIGTIAIEPPLLRRWRGLDQVVSICGICQHPLLWLLSHTTRHVGNDVVGVAYCIDNKLAKLSVQSWQIRQTRTG